LAQVKNQLRLTNTINISLKEKKQQDTYLSQKR